jgi:ABC-type Fe3+-citrate transport system substrate-binding protein
MPKAITGIALMFGVALRLAGAGQARPTERTSLDAAERTVRHLWGETKIRGTPTRVVALEFSFIDQLVALGVPPVALGGIGDTRIPEYLSDKVKAFTYVGERKDPDLEIIRSVHPDLIIANPDRHGPIRAALSQIAPTIALDDKSYSEILSNVALLGGILGKGREAANVRSTLEARIEAAKSTIQNGPSVLVVGASREGFTVWIRDSFLGSLLTGVGARYAYVGESQPARGTPEVSRLTMDGLTKIDPDYLFAYGELSRWKTDPSFTSLRAFKAGRVVEVERNLWSRGRGPIAAGLILDQGLPVLTR